jgi:hypothetical protein
MLYRIQPRLWEQTLESEGEPVLLCRSRVPELSALEERSQQRINAWYVHAEERFRRWCQSFLFPACEKRRREARERSRPFEPWTARLDFEDRTEEGSDILTIRLLLGGEGLACVQCNRRWRLKDGFLAE